MAGLIPFNRPNTSLMRSGAGFEDFYNMLDDFFSDGLRPSRSLLKDTFKIDILENDNEYVIEAEVPGVKKEEIDLSIEEDTLCIQVSRMEEDSRDGENYIHRERRSSSMSRRLRLVGGNLKEIRAKLEEGLLTVTVPKEAKVDSVRRIAIE